MLQFLYTDQVPKMNEMVGDLLEAADKYLIEPLKTQCQNALTETLSVDTCLDILTLADRFSLMELKSVVTEFILQKSSLIVTTEEWQQLKLTQPKIIFQVCDALMIRGVSFMIRGAAAVPPLGIGGGIGYQLNSDDEDSNSSGSDSNGTDTDTE